jgi:hypothetical protein
MEDIWETGISPFRRIGETFPKRTRSQTSPKQPASSFNLLLAQDWRHNLSDCWGSNTPVFHFSCLHRWGFCTVAHAAFRQIINGNALASIAGPQSRRTRQGGHTTRLERTNKHVKGICPPSGKGLHPISLDPGLAEGTSQRKVVLNFVARKSRETKKKKRHSAFTFSLFALYHFPHCRAL